MTVPTNPVQQQADDWLSELARSVTAQVLRASGPPQASQERLSTVQYETSQALEAAIEKERLYLASHTQDGVVQIGNVAPRSPQSTGMRSSLDRIQSALDALLAGTRPPDGIQPLTGIRELYHLLSGDYEMTGIFQGERIQFANVNSSTMAGMVANALNKPLVNEFIQFAFFESLNIVALRAFAEYYRPCFIRLLLAKGEQLIQLLVGQPLKYLGGS